MTSPDHIHHAIDYIEIPVTDLAEAMRFYGAAFDWHFNEYGGQYVGIRRPGRDDLESGGFRPVDSVVPGGPLVILYSEHLDRSFDRVQAAGGRIVEAPFEFPGGRRFEFADPDGNVLAVWSKE